MTRALACLLVTSLLAGCAVHEPRAFDEPEVAVPVAYHQSAAASERDPGRWWREYGEPSLDDMVESSLERNLDLAQSWARLRQALAVAKREGAPLLPALDLNGSTGYRYVVDRDAGPDTFRSSTLGYGIGGLLSYEVDLWGRIASQQEAAALDAVAARADVETTALSLSGAVVEAWLVMAQQQRLLRLIEDQAETSRTLLDLTEIRFGQGLGSALDVLQQRSQLAAVEAATPPLQSTLEIAAHQLAVLQGVAPGAVPLDVATELPQLPPFPALVQPQALLEARPDLRAAQARLRAADQRVGAALADRLPRVTLSLSYDFSAARGSGLFDREVGSFLAGLFAPIFDGGRRDAEVERQQATVRERLDAFGQAWLFALQEIEDAIVAEREQLELLRRIDGQLDLAQRTLAEARSRYVNGLVDYLTVIASVQALQTLERSQIVERKNLLSIRAGLYRALGGAWLEELTPLVEARAEETP